MPQGKCLSRALCIGALHEAMHVVQKQHNDARIIGIADDRFLGAPPHRWSCTKPTPPKCECSACATLLGLEEQVSKAALISPEGATSPTRRRTSNSAAGVLRCFKAIGTYFGELRL